jgi:hypothetical protein
MQTEPKNLPDKLSDLLKVALLDLEWVESQPEKYMINMADWYEKSYDPRIGESMCSVCLAGAVMAKTLGDKVSSRYQRNPESYDEDTSRKLRAINLARQGQIKESLEMLGQALPKCLPAYIPILRYEAHSNKFKADIKNIIKKLQKVDL